MRRHLPSFTSLLCFEASARHLNFTRASEELNLTQSAVSRQVRNLEDHVQTDLFLRIKKRLVLTEEGSKYAQAVSEHLNGLEQETMKLLSKDQNDTRLNIATFPTFGSRWLIPHLHEFTQQNPEIQFNLTTGLEPFDFKHHDIDVAIQHGDGNWADVECEKLVAETLVAVCAPSLIKQIVPLTPQSVLDHTLLTLQTRQYAWPEWLKAQGVKVKSSLNGPSFETFSMMIRAALSGLGIAIIPDMYIKEELESGKLISPFGPPVKSQRGYYLVTTTQKKEMKKVRAFMDWIKTIPST
ncbi:LysR family transcriptional regulator [Candidatus Terasakiella magnetica]|uniref:LysR family transcriptional regulator n=1 Tax=Candidatus Terasakiella magnetica TaxID=1867952 RepID=A0A1C3RLU5_9PROT|nr:transcriptional regulator GcvA [Candidatus Terasakiella magnetica]SCA58198.1 LysR family transcriptional regulator [Candidatus Terasakiella magnetica]